MTNELSVEEAIKVIDEIKRNTDMFDDLYLALNMAIKALESQKWIPVSEPPKETGDYLTTIKWRDHYDVDNYMVVKRKYYADVKIWEDSLVIAYMPKPLPEPYKESDKSETN